MLPLCARECVQECVRVLCVRQRERQSSVSASEQARESCVLALDRGEHASCDASSDVPGGLPRGAV